jgi:hypothetical protein
MAKAVRKALLESGAKGKEAKFTDAVSARVIRRAHRVLQKKAKLRGAA